MTRKTRKSRPGAGRKPRVVAHDPIALAIVRASAISEADCQMMDRTMATAIEAFARGEECAQHWASLADVASMAEVLAEWRLWGGHQVRTMVSNAQRVLSDVMTRHAERGTWTLRAGELQALRDLAWAHGHQLRTCSAGEFRRALDTVATRMRQALAGNAPRDAVVVGGMLAQPDAQARLDAVGV